MDRAGAALRQATPEARPLQVQVVAQRIEERHVRIVDVDVRRLPVHPQGDRLHDLAPVTSPTTAVRPARGSGSLDGTTASIAAAFTAALNICRDIAPSWCSRVWRPQRNKVL